MVAPATKTRAQRKTTPDLPPWADAAESSSGTQLCCAGAAAEHSNLGDTTNEQANISGTWWKYNQRKQNKAKQNMVFTVRRSCSGISSSLYPPSYGDPNITE